MLEGGASTFARGSLEGVQASKIKQAVDDQIT